MLTILTVLMLAGGTPAAAAPAAAAQPANMTTFQLVLLKKGSTPLDANAKAALDAHGAYLRKLAAARTVAASGPFEGNGDVLGVVLLRVAGADDAKAIAADDPAVKAGLFAPEIMSLMAEDRFGTWVEPFSAETLYFGFLAAGPNRGQDPQTTATLQKEHLAYMAKRHEEGKLLAAGPIVANGGARRGIVVYRMPSLAAAKEIAEGDPAVKAGRLVVELYEWRAPRGALQ